MYRVHGKAQRRHVGRQRIRELGAGQLLHKEDVDCVEEDVGRVVPPDVQAVRREVPAERQHREWPAALDARACVNRAAPEVAYQELAERSLRTQILVGAHS